MLRTIALVAVALLVSCGPIIKQAALEPPAQVSAVALGSLAVERIEPGKARQWFTDAWPYASLEGKPAPALRLHIPALDRPHYLVLKTYAVSPATHVHFGTYRYWPLEQPWMAPVALYRLGGANPVPILSFGAFKLNSNMRMTHVLGIPAPRGETWKQAAVRLEPGDAHDMLLTVDAGSVGRTEVLPGNFWPFRGASSGFPAFIVGMPIFIPIPNPPRGRVEMFMGRIGLVQVVLVPPEALIATSAGSKSRRDWLTDIKGGRTLEAVTVRVRLPRGARFGWKETRNGSFLNWMFYRPLEHGSEERLHLGDMAAPEFQGPDQGYQAVLNDIRNILGLSESHEPIRMRGRDCLLIHLRGEHKFAFDLPVRGTDLVCMIRQGNMPKSQRMIWMGGYIIYAPGDAPRPGDLTEVEQFVRSLEFIEDTRGVNRLRRWGMHVDHVVRYREFTRKTQRLVAPRAKEADMSSTYSQRTR